ncbi:hypothetical protein BURMUCGD2_6345 [Burkholderia multivorans CGD2]|uniref:Uncharacterized protein n=1 Tax=Burkholderia multivorans CGD2 TaxID=513052 RepID=B9BNS5_9BURK|nr:hypothetical protein BURMUCGD2_6345 [Burkholderia multivorans CGD2]
MNHQCICATFGCPGMRTDHCHGIVQFDNLSNARHGSSRPVVHADDRAPKHRAMNHHRVHHSGQACVDAVTSGPIHLVRRIQTFHRPSDQLEAGRILQGDGLDEAVAHRQQCCLLDQSTVSKLPAGGGVVHNPFSSATGRRFHAPGFRGGTNKKLPCDSTSSPQRLPECANGHRSTSRLDLQDRISVQRGVRRSMLKLHGIQRDLKLLRKQHRE